jgi:hypothetical protein
MSLVTGTVVDFGFSPLTPYFPLIVFTPSGPATGFGSGGLPLLLATKPIICTPGPDGRFSQELYPNEGTTPPTWYGVAIRWVNGRGEPRGTDHIKGHLVVPNAGGPITNGMLRQGLSPLSTWVTETNDIPPESEPGDFQLNVTTQTFFRLG